MTPIILDTWDALPLVDGIQRWRWIGCHGLDLQTLLIALRDTKQFPHDRLPIMLNHEFPGYPYEHISKLAASWALAKFERPGNVVGHYATFNNIAEHLHRKSDDEYCEWMSQQRMFKPFYRMQRCILVPCGYDQMRLSVESESPEQWVQNQIAQYEQMLLLAHQIETEDKNLNRGDVKVYAVWQTVRHRDGEPQIDLPREHKSLIFRAMNQARFTYSARNQKYRTLDGAITFGDDTRHRHAQSNFTADEASPLWKAAYERERLRDDETPLEWSARLTLETQRQMVEELR